MHGLYQVFRIRTIIAIFRLVGKYYSYTCTIESTKYDVKQSFACVITTQMSASAQG